MLLNYRMFFPKFIFSLLLLNTFFDNKRVEGFVRDRFNSSLQQQSDEEIIDNNNNNNNNYLVTTNTFIDNNHDKNLPNFLNKFGKIGVNYDLDVNDTEPSLKNQPFIYCQKFEQSSCFSKNPEDCTETVKCYATINTHLLACMAVSLYKINENGTVHEMPSIKSCWSQGASELRECHSEDECVVDTRRTGTIGLSAKFCCCRTHNCNAKFTFKSEPDYEEEEEEEEDNEIAKLLGISLTQQTLPPSQPTFHQKLQNYHWTLFIIGMIFLIILFLIISISFFAITQKIRKKITKKGVKQIRPISNGTNIREPLIGGEVTLSDGTKLKLHEMEIIEKIAEGRFGQVFKAKIGDRFLAIKQFVDNGEDSWTNEMDIHSMKSISKNDCIAEFLGGFYYEKKYMLLIKFYSKCSLYDYLKENTVTLFESLKMISSMLCGLSFLHEEMPNGPNSKPTIVHRDLKSKNILVRDDLSTCITDFGLALKCESSKTISPGQNLLQVGTRRYMSPEVLEGATEFTSFAFQQIDVYAAALVIWEVLSRTCINEENKEEKENIKNGKIENICLSSSPPPFMLPYEAEIGTNPSLSQIREHVALRKCRPRVRPTLMQNEISTSIVRTMSEMWDHEPDCRITSSCARDRSLIWLTNTRILYQIK
uniref:Serine/threonine-protein kinase receptor n=1 Tax=Meloidogyne hapla TaxID=6305 RepID=A0A1I8B446_MELHA